MNKAYTQEQNKKLIRQMLSLSEIESWKYTESITDESIAEFASDQRLQNVDTVYLIGHGTSLASAMNAESLFTRIAQTTARAVPAYQFRIYSGDYLTRPTKTLVVGLSCSGNTQSVVLGLEEARHAGALTMCISGSGDIKAAEVSDFRVKAHTEVEREAGMSAYSVSHLFILLGALRVALLLGEKRGVLGVADCGYWKQQWEDLKKALTVLPTLYEKAGAMVDEYEREKLHNLVVLGAGPNYGTAQEGALKICEFAWLFGACEELEDFAHGRFREVDGKIPLFILSPHQNSVRKVLDLLSGCEIAQTPVYIFTECEIPEAAPFAPNIVQMPRIQEECLTPFLYIFPLWFFGFHYRSRHQELVGERRFGLLATDINYDAYLKRHANKEKEK